MFVDAPVITITPQSADASPATFGPVTAPDPIVIAIPRIAFIGVGATSLRRLITNWSPGLTCSVGD